MARPPPSTSAQPAATPRPRWHGQCPGCGEWNTLVEERAPAGGRRAARRGGAGAAGAPRPVRAARRPRRARAAPADRHRRARPRARRRPRARLARAARRLAGHRQVDADRHGARPPGGARRTRRSTSPARSRPPRSACAPSGWPAGRAAALDVPVLAETDLDAVLRRRSRPSAPTVCVIDSVQTLHARRADAARRAASARSARSPARIMESAKRQRHRRRCSSAT